MDNTAKAWNQESLENFLDDVETGDECEIEVIRYAVVNGPNGGNRFALRVKKWRQDSTTGSYQWGYGGEYMLPTHFSPSALLQKCLKILLDYDEHERRECFRYAGRAVLAPHPNLIAYGSPNIPAPTRSRAAASTPSKDWDWDAVRRKLVSKGIDTKMRVEIGRAYQLAGTQLPATMSQLQKISEQLAWDLLIYGNCMGRRTESRTVERVDPRHIQITSTLAKKPHQPLEDEVDDGPE